jgi:Sap, sulfolipid-1-addressing protein
MWSATGGLLAIAVAMAVSSVPITATLIILLSPSRTKSSIPFLAGWVVGISVVVLAAAFGVLALPVSRRERLTAIAIAEIVVGCALVAFGILTLRRSGRAASDNRKNWLDGLGSMGRLASFGVGFAMGFRPKALLLGAAAGLVLASARLNPTETAIAVSLYVAISASTVAVPVVWTLTSPTRMEPRLLAWRDWLNRHGPLFTGLLMMIIGVVITGAGIVAL